MMMQDTDNAWPSGAMLCNFKLGGLVALKHPCVARINDGQLHFLVLNENSRVIGSLHVDKSRETGVPHARLSLQQCRCGLPMVNWGSQRLSGVITGRTVGWL